MCRRATQDFETRRGSATFATGYPLLFLFLVNKESSLTLCKDQFTNQLIHSHKPVCFKAFMSVSPSTFLSIVSFPFNVKKKKIEHQETTSQITPHFYSHRTSLTSDLFKDGYQDSCVTSTETRRLEAQVAQKGARPVAQKEMRTT